MRSAQRRNRIQKNHKRNPVLRTFIKIAVPVFVLVVIFAFIKFNTRYWNGQDKVSFVFSDSRGNVGVTVLDPELMEETTLIIPGDTQVEVARNYGQLRIKNVWQLGINEKLDGALLAQTITNKFLFPTNLWCESNLTDLWKFIFSPGKTNILFGDRLRMAIFAIKIKGIDKTEIDLGKSQFLHKQKLIDGESGYIMSGPVSGRLTVYFSDNRLSRSQQKFGLVDASGKAGVSDGVGAILEVLGGKVVSLEKKPQDDSLDCQVLGKNSYAVKKISDLFNCQKVSENSEMDLEMRIGSKFAKRF